MYKKQSGFAVLESLLILIIIAIIGGTGYYVWHSKSQTDKNLDNASTTGQNTVTAKKSTSDNTQATPSQLSSDTASTQRYLNIKEWGVRIPYSGNDTYSYKFTNSAQFISSNLSQKYDCNDSGAGILIRYSPTDGAYADGSGPAVSDDAKQNPSNYVQAGGYYYRFTHDQQACSDTVSIEAENDANNAMAGFVKNLEVSPK